MWWRKWRIAALSRFSGHRESHSKKSSSSNDFAIYHRRDCPYQETEQQSRSGHRKVVMIFAKGPFSIFIDCHWLGIFFFVQKKRCNFNSRIVFLKYRANFDEFSLFLSALILSSEYGMGPQQYSLWPFSAFSSSMMYMYNDNESLPLPSQRLTRDGYI